MLDIKKDLERCLKQANKTTEQRIYDALKQVEKSVDELDFKALTYPEEVEKISNLEKEGDQKAANTAAIKLDKLHVSNDQKAVHVVNEIIAATERVELGLRVEADDVALYLGSYWVDVNHKTIATFLSTCAKNTGMKECDADGDKFVSIIGKTFRHKLKSFEFHDDLDITKINLKNGTLHISGGRAELLPHSQDDGLRTLANFNYDPAAKCPKWISTLNTSIPEKEKQELLQEMAASVFIRHGSNNIEIDKMLVMLGSGANGKSVVINGLKPIFGEDNISEVSLTNICAEKGYYRAALKGKTVNFISELGGKKLQESDVFKKLISGEPVTARQPAKPVFTLKNPPRLIAAANVLPAAMENTYGTFRRFAIIKFEKTIPKSERNPNLSNELLQESSGILNWVLEGLDRIMTRGKLIDSGLSDEAVAQFREDNDAVLQFINEFELKPAKTGGATSVKKAHDLYKIYCSSSGYSSLGRAKFKNSMISHGFRWCKSYSGIKNALLIGNFNETEIRAKL
jgi:putative DNA primase/helicase